ncbi:hypothetical protein SPRG_05481 [Saprolegnia parasitica CBS 223.65]|uniref:DOPA 4,5-dioxygenase n=1 Tax=Saprolegnia parasitica (strain CBS 223.65) TaxID=695850 RepID=A0A067CFJ0_SAPPC|nr:hypothetical protein SPRG_05481 [Saprolegnia parasitica CBS 223.65]KDO29524.1 hypothetical protein SPRG_05481 [Saprolegnia parasitica CBS 223.65]|eukprot:XP_012199590.1 hypothetical protein SPRG_05481 [Saprolegnia parasitica CBS 223.65]
MAFREWHFHTYFHAENPEELAKVVALRNALVANLESKDRRFVAVPLHHYVGNNTTEPQVRVKPTHGLNLVPVGPHPIGSFETWAPVEHFAEVYSWFVANRNGLSVFMHPLTREEVRDHTERAAWMGTPLVLDVSTLETQLAEPASQYPFFQLGYATE